jgi:hypothetical protein
MSSLFYRPTKWSGNTYPIRAELRALGGQWDAELKCWHMPAGNMRERAAMSELAHKAGRGVSVEAK